MQQFLLFLFLHIPLHVSAYKAFFVWALVELFVVTLLRAEPHVGCFVISNILSRDTGCRDKFFVVFLSLST
jgi:hypothetical protein